MTMSNRRASTAAGDRLGRRHSVPQRFLGNDEERGANESAAADGHDIGDRRTHR